MSRHTTTKESDNKKLPRTGNGQTISEIEKSIAVDNFPVGCRSAIATTMRANAGTGLAWLHLIWVVLIGIVILLIVFFILLVLLIFLVLFILLIVLLVIVKFALLRRLGGLSAVYLRRMRLGLLCGCSRAARCADDGAVLVQLDGTRERTGTWRRRVRATGGYVALLDVRVLL